MPFRTEGSRAQETEGIGKQGKENQERERTELEQGADESWPAFCVLRTVLAGRNGAGRGSVINGAVCELCISVIKLGTAQGPSSPQVAFSLISQELGLTQTRPGVLSIL